MLLPTARRLYREIFNREFLRSQAALKDHLRPFVPKGSVVFDVGGFRGDYAAALKALGARVVSVEPLPWRAQEIHRRVPGVAVEECAVSAEAGEAVLRVGRYQGHSTISGTWAEAHPGRFTSQIVVRTMTLDMLIEKFGHPAFVKIDVEGHEDKALAGLSRPVNVIAFEFQKAALDVTERCLAILQGRSFNYVSGERAEFRIDSWVSGSALLAALERAPEDYGDIYAR